MPSSRSVKRREDISKADSQLVLKESGILLPVGSGEIALISILS